MGYRLALIVVGFVAAYSLLLFHLYGVQIGKNGTLLARAESKNAAAINLWRGAIYFTDKNGNHSPAALQKEFPLIYAVPKEIEDPEEAAHGLALILNQAPDELLKKLSKKNDEYEVLSRRPNLEIQDKVKTYGAKGVYVRNMSLRFYPFENMAAQALGFVGPDGNSANVAGHYGLEEFYGSELRNKDIYVTIDQNIQLEVERILEKVIKEYAAKSGSVIVEDPKTGKILAMAGAPSFDPNKYSESPLKNFLNANVQEIYEPGSVFKVLTMAAGIDAGKITPETEFYDPGFVVISGKKIQNWDKKTHGTITMTQVIEQSVNTGAIFAGQKTGNQVLREYLQKFGFEEKTGIDLPGEVRGSLKTLYDRAPAVNFATASYGQGVSTTPLELIGAVAAIANGGTLIQPHLNADAETTKIRRVIKESTAKAVAGMMVSAVDKAEVAKIPGYSLAGKTGTAFIPDFKNGGYTDKVINTYVGFGPTSDPKFIILIKLVEPAGAPVAGLTVVPAFRNLAQFILNYYNIAPDRIQN